jgi:predicted CoA-substrate-specific enzyme activase
MTPHSNVLGIDIGSVSVSMVEVTPERETVNTAYAFHHGNITRTVRTLLEDFDLPGICGIAATTSTPPVLKVNRRYDNRIAIMKAAHANHAALGGILFVGGEKFGLIRFDAAGNYLAYKSNTSCAAGTGSFLDQQAGRLGLSGIDELSRIAFENSGPIPKIASRCAVFAKTDLIHAQQEGYSLAQICDGLCRGLAKNIVDTLFDGEAVAGPILFAGGVSKNRAVVRHIHTLVDQDIVTETSLYGAAGAALNLLDELLIKDRIHIRSVDEIIRSKHVAKKMFYPPLTLKQSRYPVFESVSSRLHADVEIDIYEPLKDTAKKAFMGIDIGSTSTKAVLLGTSGNVLAGFYTRTAGRPVEALQKILAAIHTTLVENSAALSIAGAATTGSGRKFLGKIIGADLVLDEITAHARAAVQLDPKVDTIIEIGGQDSKFTTLKDGRVTFSTMNTVCAAGTGSFIEEQARKLGCPLADYSRRTENRSAPVSSDRCTVFMERDINHLLSEGYAIDDALASVLHSIVENYLTKVATEHHIGDTVFFQGATAKNRALVAAFEQRLEKPIHVSEFCHLTGAIGAALSLADEPAFKTTFKGIGLYERKIPITSEVCQLCTNHCKITVAAVDREKVAYGFLCGRDYDTGGYVNNNRSGVDLIKTRKQVFKTPAPERERGPVTIGLPAALHMHADLPFWKHFFQTLSIPTITSERVKGSVKLGKRMAGAEFCAPMVALHGHVAHLLEKADFVFLPFYLEQKTEGEGRRQYCYYTQFSPTVVSAVIPEKDRRRLLMPLARYLYSSFHIKMELWRLLKSILPGKVGFFDISSAYDAATAFMSACRDEMKKIYRKKIVEDELHVILLGRPYTVLSSDMNKRIPEIFGTLGIKAFFQDQVPDPSAADRSLAPLLTEIHWHYAAKILSAAHTAARTPGAYPVFITSFKCTPDSFVAEYFKKIMESHKKPYLILQLDDHDSSVGYETRIEAAVRAFQNHSAGAQTSAAPRLAPALIPKRERQLDGRTLLLPNWDPLTLRLTSAALQREGIDVRLLEESADTTAKGLRRNTGQCIPLNIIAQACIDYIEKHDLDPARTVLWNAKSSIACNLALFPHHIRSILSDYGQGMEKVGVYSGSLSFLDLSLKVPLNVYFSYMFGGLIRKMGCRIRPYEQIKGQTDAVIEESIGILSRAFSGERSKESALADVIARFEAIEQHPGFARRPKVAIFGDLYVRDNDMMNDHLVRFIEENGGEAVVTPYSSYIKMIANPYLKKWFREGLYLNVLSTKALLATAHRMEKTYAKAFSRILADPEPDYSGSPEKILRQYDIRSENTGEAIESVLKIAYLLEQYPDISLFVQTIPAFCCPSLVTEAMAGRIERKTGVPIVSITYDGTGGNKNDAIVPYLKYPRAKAGKRARRASNA